MKNWFKEVRKFACGFNADIKLDKSSFELKVLALKNCNLFFFFENTNEIEILGWERQKNWEEAGHKDAENIKRIDFENKNGGFKNDEINQISPTSPNICSTSSSLGITHIPNYWNTEKTRRK